MGLECPETCEFILRDSVSGLIKQWIWLAGTELDRRPYKLKRIYSVESAQNRIGKYLSEIVLSFRSQLGNLKRYCSAEECKRINMISSSFCLRILGVLLTNKSNNNLIIWNCVNVKIYWSQLHLYLPKMKLDGRKVCVHTQK